MSDLYRLVYASKNHLVGTEAEVSAAVSQILEASQRNNVKVEVTGALMFNAGAFAQVLEGPRRGVETTFERIQRDLRHGDVTVLQCGPADGRGFPNWSMAFVGQSARGQVLWDAISAKSGFDTTRMDGDAIFAVLRDLVLDKEKIAATDFAESSIPVEVASGGGLDVARVQAELLSFNRDLRGHDDTIATNQIRSPDLSQTSSIIDNPAPDSRFDKADQGIALAVCQAALSRERQRTTELREEIDELQIMLAAKHACLAAMQNERDLWSERTRVLAALMIDEANDSSEDATRTKDTRLLYRPRTMKAAE